jgi:hypothetical protein
VRCAAWDGEYGAGIGRFGDCVWWCGGLDIAGTKFCSVELIGQVWCGFSGLVGWRVAKKDKDCTYLS